MSTPTKENTKKTSDPVLQSSGEVLQEVKEKFKEEKEPTLQDIFSLLTDTKKDTANLMVRMEVMILSKYLCFNSIFSFLFPIL